MSGIVNKIKDVLHKDKDTTSSTTHTHGVNDPNSNVSSATSHSTNHGGHDSNLANKADPRIDSDRDGSRIPGQAGHSGVSSTHGTGLTGNNHSTTHNTGLTGNTHSSTHNTGLTGNTHSNTHSHGVNDPNSNVASATSHSTNHGGHDSNVANKLDPRVDSDRDGSRIPGQAGHSGVSSSTHGTGHNSALGSNTHSSTTGNYGSTTSGPHSSDMANKLDPRVDSDNSKVHGSHQTGNTSIPFGSSLSGNTHNTAGHSNVTGSNTHSGLTGSNTHGHGVTGHNSALPGVQNNNASHLGTNTGHSTTHGSTNNGPHDSNLANKADPRVDSDLSSTGNRHGANTGGVFGASGSHATSGSGTAQNTSGPHNSDLLNKLDPRVDSDKDGSKTVGGNKTHA